MAAEFDCAGGGGGGDAVERVWELHGPGNASGDVYGAGRGDGDGVGDERSGEGDRNLDGYNIVSSSTSRMIAGSFEGK